MADRRRGRPAFNDGKTSEGITIRWSPEVKQWVRKAARRNEMSVAQFLGALLEEKIEQDFGFVEHK